MSVEQRILGSFGCKTVKDPIQNDYRLTIAPRQSFPEEAAAQDHNGSLPPGLDLGRLRYWQPVVKWSFHENRTIYIHWIINQESDDSHKLAIKERT